MDEIDFWLQRIAALVTIVGLAGTLLVLVDLRRRLHRPKLVCGLVPDPYREELVDALKVSTTIDQQRNRLIAMVRFGIQNRGDATADDVECYVIVDQRVGKDGVTPLSEVHGRVIELPMGGIEYFETVERIHPQRMASFRLSFVIPASMNDRVPIAVEVAARDVPLLRRRVEIELLPK